MAELSFGDGFALRPYIRDDSDWVAAAHAAHYRLNEGFDSGFEDAVRHALAEINERLGLDRTFGLILVDAHAMPHGSIFACDAGASARLRLFYLDSALQGRGLGQVMLDAAMQSASVAGFEKIEVSTFDAHAAACRLYARTGFAEQSRAPVRAFGREMVQIDFACDLSLRNSVAPTANVATQTRQSKHG